MSNVIEYDPLVSFLKQASAFEIYRMTVALQNELDNPTRLAQISTKIKVDDPVEWYDSATNAFIKAIIMGKTAKRVIVQNLHDGRRWQIPLYWLKLDSREFVFEQKEKGLNKNSIKVSDFVGFYHQKLGKDITGQVERLNPKTVSILTSTQQRWRVPYSLLYPVIEGQQAEVNQVIEYQLD